MRPRFASRLAPFLIVLVLSATAQAAVPQDLEASEQAYASLDYDKANKLADALAKQKGLTHDQLVRTYRVLARTHAVLDHENAAIDAYYALLTYDPDYPGDPNLGPKVNAPFLEARGRWRMQSQKPGIEVTSSLHAHEAGVLRVTTHDPTHIVKKVSLGFRWGSQAPFTNATTTVGENSSVDIPASPANVSRLEYYAQALDDRDDVVFEMGNPSAPKSATAEASSNPGPGVVVGTGPGTEKSGSSVFSSPIFWGVVVAVLAGGATAVYFATRSPEEKLLPPTRASLSPFFQCGATRCN